MIVFTKHAEDKFKILKKHDFVVSRRQVLETIINPESIDRSREPLLIGQRKIDQEHMLRVVYKKEEDNILKVITFYPARIEKYEKK